VCPCPIVLVSRCVHVHSMSSSRRCVHGPGRAPVSAVFSLSSPCIHAMPRCPWCASLSLVPCVPGVPFVAVCLTPAVRIFVRGLPRCPCCTSSSMCLCDQGVSLCRSSFRGLPLCPQCSPVPAVRLSVHCVTLFPRYIVHCRVTGMPLFPQYIPVFTVYHCARDVPLCSQCVCHVFQVRPHVRCAMRPTCCAPCPWRAPM
jgi:hypothetical protein